MYNPCNERGKEVRYLPYNHSVTSVLPPLLASTPASSLIIVAGDFNLSHPEWNESVGDPDEAAEEAVRTFSRFNLIHYLAPNTITYHPHNTEHPKKPLDLVLGSLRAEERVVSCGVAEDLESGSDHRPVRLVLALETTTYTPPRRRAFRRTEPEVLERAFLDAAAHLPTSPLLTPADIDKRALELTEALQIAISAATPFARARAGRVTPWWDEELAKASKSARRDANLAFRLRGIAGREREAEEAWRKKKKSRNEVKTMMRRKKDEWEELEMASVTEATLWTTVKKRISESSTANLSTPPLRKGDGTYATSPLDKLALLRPILLPTVTPNSPHSPAPFQPPVSSPQSQPPPARNPDIPKPRWTEPQPAKAGKEEGVSGVQVSPGFIVHSATHEADDRRASEPERTAAESTTSKTTAATTTVPTAEKTAASTLKTATSLARTSSAATRTRTARKKGEGGGEGKSTAEMVPVGEERQQVRSLQSYRNLREAGAAWYEPAKGRDRTKELARVLKTAAMAVSGGFRSAAGEALEVEAGLLPIHLELDRAVLRLGLRSLSATPSHPLHPRAARARHDPAIRHPSPLDRALAFPLLSNASVEPIHPDPIPPWSPDPAPPVELAQGKELGTYHHRLLVESLPTGTLLVYSDGSMGDSGVVGAGIAGRQWVGGSKVVLEEGEEAAVEGWETRSKGMGQHQTVYAGELQGILLALQAVQYTADPPSHVLLSVDNTSALTHLTDPSPSSGQHLRLAIRETLEELQRTCVSTRILLSWSPGHVGVVGNEVADLAAKEAVRAMESAEREREQRKERRTHLKGRMVFVPEMAELSSSSEDEGSEWEEGERGGRSTRHLAKSTRLTQLDHDDSLGLGLNAQLPASISALWTEHKKATRMRWDEEWRRSSAGRQLFAASQLASRSAKYYDGLSRRQATLLCRLRTGACSLNAYRAMFDSTRDPLCSCGEDETREHLLTACPLYDQARKSLLQHLRLRKLPTAGALLGNPSYRIPLLDFLDSTGRFPRLSKPPEVEKREKE